MQKKSPTTKPKRGGTLHRILDAGTTSVVIDGDHLVKSSKPLWTAHKAPVEGEHLVTKIVTNPDVFQKELELSAKMQSVDPEQTYFLYPIAAYKIAVDLPLLDAAHRMKIPEQDLAPRGHEMYALVMPFGGVSIKKWDNTHKMTLEEAYRLIGDALYGMNTLHSRKIAHGDVQVHNFMIHRDASGVHGFFIDTGKIRTHASHDILQTDVEGLWPIVQKIVNLVPESKEVRAKLRKIMEKKGMYNTSSVATILGNEAYEDVHPRQMHPLKPTSPSSSPANTPVAPRSQSKTPGSAKTPKALLFGSPSPSKATPGSDRIKAVLFGGDVPKKQHSPKKTTRIPKGPSSK